MWLRAKLSLRCDELFRTDFGGTLASASEIGRRIRRRRRSGFRRTIKGRVSSALERGAMVIAMVMGRAVKTTLDAASNGSRRAPSVEYMARARAITWEKASAGA